jgi:cell division protein FtsL
MKLVRLLNLIVVAALVVAAAYVYKIKFESTLQAERVAKLRSEIRKERDTIAALRAEWSQLDSPSRIQGIAERHLTLKPVEATQFDTLEHVPERPLDIVPPDSPDPIATMIEKLGAEGPTGSIKGGPR